MCSTTTWENENKISNESSIKVDDNLVVIQLWQRGIGLLPALTPDMFITLS